MPWPVAPTPTQTVRLRPGRWRLLRSLLRSTAGSRVGRLAISRLLTILIIFSCATHSPGWENDCANGSCMVCGSRFSCTRVAARFLHAALKHVRPVGRASEQVWTPSLRRCAASVVRKPVAAFRIQETLSGTSCGQGLIRCRLSVLASCSSNKARWSQVVQE